MQSYEILNRKPWGQFKKHPTSLDSLSYSNQGFNCGRKVRNSANGLFIYFLLQAHWLYPSYLHPSSETHTKLWQGRWASSSFPGSGNQEVISHFLLHSISSSEQTGILRNTGYCEKKWDSQFWAPSTVSRTGQRLQTHLFAWFPWS